MEKVGVRVVVVVVHVPPVWQLWKAISLRVLDGVTMVSVRTRIRVGLATTALAVEKGAVKEVAMMVVVKEVASKKASDLRVLALEEERMPLEQEN